MYYYQFNCSRISWLLPECVVMLLLSWSYHKMVWLHSVGKLNYWYASYFYRSVISDSIVFISNKTICVLSHSWYFRKDCIKLINLLINHFDVIKYKMPYYIPYQLSNMSTGVNSIKFLGFQTVMSSYFRIYRLFQVLFLCGIDSGN